MCVLSKTITAAKQTAKELVFPSMPLVGTEGLENILGEHLFFFICTRYLMPNIWEMSIWWLWKVSLGAAWSTEEQAVTVQLSLQLPDWDNQQFIVYEIFSQKVTRIFRSPLLSTPKQTAPDEVNEIQRSLFTSPTRILATVLKANALFYSSNITRKLQYWF